MSQNAFIFLYLNMGSEMMYIIEQRLNAQNICKLRAQKGWFLLELEWRIRWTNILRFLLSRKLFRKNNQRLCSWSIQVIDFRLNYPSYLWKNAWTVVFLCDYRWRHRLQMQTKKVFFWKISFYDENFSRVWFRNRKFYTHAVSWIGRKLISQYLNNIFRAKSFKNKNPWLF